jgi:peroxiredoxin
LDVAEKLRPLDNRIREQLAKWFAAREAAAAQYGWDSEEQHTADERNRPLAVHGDRILEYAREHPGTPEALACLNYIVDLSEGGLPDVSRPACAELIAHEKDNPALSWVCSRCTNALFLDVTEDFLQKLLQSSTNPTVQAAAAFHLAELQDKASETLLVIDDRRKQFGESGLRSVLPNLDLLEKRSREELTARRDELLALVVEKYPDETPWTAKRTFGRLDYKFHEDPQQPIFRELAKGLSYEIKNLRVGCTAPDFTGKDIDGERFRLSENRGRPVLLMFSFKGCGPCEATYPALRKVQERFFPKGLFILGVMADQTAETVRETVDAGEITWRCVWDGRSGPIAELYRVEHYPTLLLIDGEGRIAARPIRREEYIVAAIEKVLDAGPAK